MNDTMKALVAHAPYDYRYEDVPVPAIGPGEMLLRVLACGVCAGDIKSFHGGARIWGTSEENRYIDAPVTGGHEICGEVVALEGVDGFSVGDRVVCEQILPCGDCHFCTTGAHWLCTRSAVFGFKEVCPGGFAEYVRVPATAICHRVPDSLTLEQAALVEPIACGMHVRADRVARGLEFGADIVLNAAECDVDEEIRTLTDGLGCDVYVEVSGAARSITQGLDALRNRGRFVQMGVLAGPVDTDWNMIGDGKELTIRGSHLSGRTYPAVLRGIETGRIRTDGLVTHTFGLSRWQEAFAVSESEPGALKVLLVPDPE